MADESAYIPPSGLSEAEQRRANRATRRQQMREAAAPPPPDIEPELDPTPCDWCGFVAFFEPEIADEDKVKCPACGTAYDRPFDPDDRLTMRDVVLRRHAFALDRIAGILQEAWDEACDRLGIS